MKQTIEKIYTPVREDFEKFETMLGEVLRSEYPLLDEISTKILNMSGKRMRPLLTLLVARMHGEVDEQHLVSAVIMEVTHNASLVHDDVLDEAYTRRGELTAMALLRSKGAVLAGDFLLTQAVSLGVERRNYRAVDMAARTLKQLVEGELRQMKNALLLNTTTEEYFNVIRLKTAYLMAASASLGATEERAQEMYRFGELLGEAFQIQDDILDYTGTQTGKEPLNDVKEGKMTLPLLLALENCNEKEAQTLMQNFRKGANDTKAAQEVAQQVITKKGVELSSVAVEKRCTEALQLIENYETSPAKEALTELVRFLGSRSY